MSSGETQRADHLRKMVLGGCGCGQWPGLILAPRRPLIWWLVGSPPQAALSFRQLKGAALARAPGCLALLIPSARAAILGRGMFRLPLDGMPSFGVEFVL